jgi:arabinose-5-phosphate isomerase
MRVADVFDSSNAPTVKLTDRIREVIVEISSKRLGATAVLNAEGKLAGVITDGDLRRMLQRNEPIEKFTASDIMSVHPKTIEKDELAINAFNMMETNKITQLVVTERGSYIGLVHIHDILREGIV